MKYKTKVKLLMFSVFLFISALPVTNYLIADDKQNFKYTRAGFFNVDYFFSIIQARLFDLGVSLNAEQSYIGKEGWLFLGDQYDATVSTRRIGLTEEEKIRADKIIQGFGLWDKYFKSHGVEAFQIMIGPDKETIYPEYLPEWAKASGPTRTDALFFDKNSDLFFDTRKPLLMAKSFYKQRIYYKTDTHWNSLGAWVAFDAFIKSLSDKGSIDGKWLTKEQVSRFEVVESKGGDLSGFLRLSGDLLDEDVVFNAPKIRRINVERTEYYTGEVLGNKGNPYIGTPKTVLLAKSDGALNIKKVLWLRDSFGSAVSPFMSATFSEVLQVHYGNIDDAIVKELLEKFQPDYVFITAVEKGLLDLNMGLKDLP